MICSSYYNKYKYIQYLVLLLGITMLIGLFPLSCEQIEKEPDISYYNELIELNPHNHFSYHRRGILKVQGGDYKGALQDYTKSIELEPNDAEIYSSRSILKFKLGDKRGGMQDINKVIELDPNNSSAYFVRGIAKIQLDQKDSGCLDLSKAGELGYMDAYDLIKKYCQ